MDKQKLIERLEMLKRLTEDAESNMRLAVISYKKYQDTLVEIMKELDEIEKMVKDAKSRSFFDLFFGNPIKVAENNFNREVHQAINEVEDGTRAD